MEGTFIDGKYEVIRQLGQGGMGAVYEARHRSTGRKVAVKVIVPAALAGGLDIIARFQREARASGSIDSPFVVQVFDAGVDSATGAPYMAMECLAGEDVQAAVGRLGPLPPHVLLRITAHACHGLQKAHEAGIVHRDIKSANVFLARSERDNTEILAKILDFGIAKVRASPLASGEDHKLTKTGSMLGSPVYMSPEQAIGATNLDARSDIFSMGVLMYEALSGATPNGHLENLGALLMAICSQEAQAIQERAPWVPPDVAAIVHKALALKPEDRYQSAAELRAAVVALLPDGRTTLEECMLVPLSVEEKLHRSPRHLVLRPASSPNVATVGLSKTESAAHLPITSMVADGSRTGTASMTTTAGLGSSDQVPKGVPRSVRWSVVVAALAGVVSVSGGVVYLTQKRPPSAAQPAFGLTATEPYPLRERPRTQTVTVSPAGATVEVDGKAVEVSGGRFDVIGGIGSVHDVRTMLAGVEKHTDVVIATTGPRPAHLELTPPASPPPIPALASAEPRPNVVVRPNAAAVRQPPALVTAPVAQPVAPPPPRAMAPQGAAAPITPATPPAAGPAPDRVME